ncbi:MAG: D-hexose-6-phosphate mutarotase [Bacteroidales bacterium]|nr:D-hexose-6-phosphate mutarotase [Bacteroidales bacterium]
MMTIDELDEKFGIEGELGFIESEGDLLAISIFNKYADAEISLYGGQVMRYTPQGSFDVLWVSESSFFEEGKAIRGGIPVCFPWFGPHPTDPGKPMHGFARLKYWQVVETASLETGDTKVILQLTSDEETKALWQHDFRALLTVIIGRSLDVSLTVTNTGSEPLSYSSALHSYFNVSGIASIRVAGLEGKTFYNGFESTTNVQQEELLAIEKEENRRYVNVINDCLIIDQPFNQITRVAKRGSNVTVVWNPGSETAAKMDDITDEGWQEFICVEAVNAYNDIIHLSAGQSHTTATTISLDLKASNLRMSEQDSSFTVI